MNIQNESCKAAFLGILSFYLVALSVFHIFMITLTPVIGWDALDFWVVKLVPDLEANLTASGEGTADLSKKMGKHAGVVDSMFPIVAAYIGGKQALVFAILVSLVAYVAMLRFAAQTKFSAGAVLAIVVFWSTIPLVENHISFIGYFDIFVGLWAAVFAVASSATLLPSTRRRFACMFSVGLLSGMVVYSLKITGALLFLIYSSVAIVIIVRRAPAVLRYIFWGGVIAGGFFLVFHATSIYPRPLYYSVGAFSVFLDSFHSTAMFSFRTQELWLVAPAPADLHRFIESGFVNSSLTAYILVYLLCAFDAFFSPASELERKIATFSLVFLLSICAFGFLTIYGRQFSVVQDTSFSRLLITHTPIGCVLAFLRVGSLMERQSKPRILEGRAENGL